MITLPHLLLLLFLLTSSNSPPLSPGHPSRFATDLALWQPATPSQVERANAAKSLFFSSVDIQPAATAEEKFQMCKSVLRGQCGMSVLHSYAHVQF